MDRFFTDSSQFPKGTELARQDIGATPHAGDLDESGQRFMKAGWHATIERMILLVVVDDVNNQIIAAALFFELYLYIVLT